MMGLSHCLLLFFIFFFKGCNTGTSHELSYCHDEESFALLQFKQSFTINASASGLEGAYPKVLSWKQAQGGNNISCCTWDGVECDEHTGHVIGLDLRSSCLYGSIHSNSSLFSLVHLRGLNLADNHFNYSQIPTSIRNFPRLTHLDLSASVFSGQVPSEVSQLVKLSLLDLSFNTDPSSGVGLLTLDGSNLRSLVQNLTNLQHLRLRFINISSPIPDSMANLSFLTTLDFHQCHLFGDFPVRIFQLQNLQNLYLRDNQDLIGYLPEFNKSSPLITLDVHGTRFSGNLALSIRKLGSLKQLDVAACNFSAGLVPSSLGNLRELTYLDISANPFGGPVPDSFANLTKLSVFRISSSLLTGPIPSWLGNFSELKYLDFNYNSLSGSIPTSFSNLTNLQILYLQSNNLSGIVEFQTFQNLQNLKQLVLSSNSLEFFSESTAVNASTVPQFTHLKLTSCNLREFPYFLSYQKHLQYLLLNRNKIHGQVPKWMWNMSTESLVHLDISYNFLSGQLPVFFPWVNQLHLGLSSNMFHGPLPIPASSTLVYEAHTNKFTGKLSPVICNMSSLRALELDNNNLSGMIPQCFGNFSDPLTLLLLRNNSFHGTLPQTYTNKSNLRILDVSQNQLQGQLPRSLANCLMLETLVLSNNYFNDVFPFWMATLPELKLLAMRHNAFQGLIGKGENNQRFPKLRVFDISHNNFTGKFVAEYVFSKYAMRSVNQSTYISVVINYDSGNDWLGHEAYDSTINITIKGVDRYYPRIQEAFAVIDISSNKFEGKIDESIGSLKGLWSLNFSNNLLSGRIPSSFGNLTNLEVLDLSNNKLWGEIPKQLAQLTFLAQFNVSHNNLTGPIPRGPQLNTFSINSYKGNPGLCGDPLPKRCQSSNAPPELPPSNTEENDSGSEFEWAFVLAGCGSGFVVGVVLADLAITRRREFFLEIVGTLIRLMERITSRKGFGR
ncbi:putative leucine-rich repeat-containing, plant-type, leucine-rich repeat domain, L [Rosa chinensis]|uniref:Putative leucine-rich repeat-containing, plant-type, leucine-rich repeat domain, L n=1 Tax=Rosa chinensis TaxID=74649 RepID=A0A2P6SKS9_ROSCH|nr:putative leucine-rich repeat-containing, plant-type, leucine-rich repeat domain, L [Rosa chinensis]